MYKLSMENIQLPEKQTNLPERVIQFGEGNFLRGFIDWMIHEMNEKGLFQGRIVAIQPTPHGKVVPKLNKQNGLYTLILRGMAEGKIVDHASVITSISRGINPYSDWKEVLKLAENKEVKFVFSNTTEAGLTYIKEEYHSLQSPLSYPGKLASFLYHRYESMNGAIDAGMTIFPLELVENNGDVLKNLVLKISKDWGFSNEFRNWVLNHNTFCNTLVDRIVTGYPKEHISEWNRKLGYEDDLLTMGEPYHLLVVEGDEKIEASLPFDQAGLQVVWGDVKPYRDRKVRILNGAHTLMFATAFLSGHSTVREAMEDDIINRFVMKGIMEEIIPILPFEDKQKKDYVQSVVERFMNPFSNHYLADISLQSITKFQTRIIPTLLDWEKQQNKLPDTIIFSLAALIYFYKMERIENGRGIAKHGSEEYEVHDKVENLQFFNTTWVQYHQSGLSLEEFVQVILSNQYLWGRDLNSMEGLSEAVSAALSSILEFGMNEAVEKWLDPKKRSLGREKE